MKVIQRIRSYVIELSCGLMNWVSEHVNYESLEHDIGWKDHLRWWLEGQLGRVFNWAYKGSDEEIRAVYQSEVPLKYMSERQRAVLTEPRSEYSAHCCNCRWVGLWSECEGDHDCPECGKDMIYLDAFHYQTEEAR